MTIIATIVVLGVLIFVHELGHFGAAKMVGVKVERFSIGLGPRVWGVTRGETEYVLSAVPLGGYVKMGGMDDEVMERIEGGGDEETRRSPSPRDFDAKPLWARAFVISAGVIMNMIFAFGVYAFSAGWWGVRQIDTTRIGEIRTELLPDGAESLGRVPVGARIVSLDGTPVKHWGDVTSTLLDAPAGPLRIRTESPEEEVEIRVPAAEEERISLVRSLGHWAEPAVGAVNPGSPAEDAGLQAGDRIVAVDDQPLETWYAFVRAIQAHPGEEVRITLEREGSRLYRDVTTNVTTITDPVSGESRRVGAIGVYMPVDEIVYEKAGLGQAVVYGWRETVAITVTILDFLKQLVTGGISPRSMGSIVTIGQASGQAASMGVDAFLRFMALFSVNLAILNLLPIPVLDGGHLLFLAIEGVRGRALSVEQRIRWSNVGFVIIMGIMLWALGNDMLRLFGL
jgi:regulator of sigma E protease